MIDDPKDQCYLYDGLGAPRLCAIRIKSAYDSAPVFGMTRRRCRGDSQKRRPLLFIAPSSELIAIYPILLRGACDTEVSTPVRRQETRCVIGPHAGPRPQPRRRMGRGRESPAERSTLCPSARHRPDRWRLGALVAVALGAWCERRDVVRGYQDVRAHRRGDFDSSMRDVLNRCGKPASSPTGNLVGAKRAEARRRGRPVTCRHLGAVAALEALHDIASSGRLSCRCG